MVVFCNSELPYSFLKLLRNKIKDSYIKYNNSRIIHLISKKTMYLINNCILSQLKKLRDLPINEIFIQMFDFILRRAGSYLRHDSIIVIFNGIKILKELMHEEFSLTYLGLINEVMKEKFYNWRDDFKNVYEDEP